MTRTMRKMRTAGAAMALVIAPFGLTSLLSVTSLLSLTSLLSVTSVTGLAGCGGDRLPPKSLVDAREEFSHAKGGIAIQLDPTDVHEADLALQRAEQAFSEAPDDQNTIEKIAAVKDDDRGMVITLQGEVLFKTGEYKLKAGAMAKLDQIAEALKGKEQPIVVYGFTDNVGGLDMNMTLSQNRAQSVRDYLVQKGIPQDLITAQGKGPSDPVSDNTSVEGRSANRRVELVVSPKKS